MPSITDVRAQNPKFAAGKTDWDLTLEIAKRNKADPWQVAQDFGVAVPREETGFLDSFQRGIGQGVASAGSMLRDLTPGLGGAIEQFGRGVVERNPRQYTTSEDVLASPLSAAAEQIPETLGQVLPAAAALLLTKNPAAAAAIMGGSSYVQNVGETRSRQRELGQDTGEDIGRAYTYGVPQALLDAAFGTEAAALRLFGKTAGKGLTEAGARELAEQGLLKTIGKEGLKAAVVEAPTEVGQSVLGRMATKEDLTSKDAAEEYFMSAFAGLTGGGAMGAAIGPMTRANASGFVNQIDTARSTLAEPLTSLDQLPLKEQAAAFLQGVVGSDVGLTAAADFASAQSERLVQDKDVLLDGIAKTKAAEFAVEEQRIAQDAAATAAAERQKVIDDQIASMESDLERVAREQETAQKEAETARLETQGAERTARDSGFVQPVLKPPMPTDLLGDPLFTPLESARVQPFEAQFDMGNINDQITLGQQIDMSLRNAQATGDAGTADFLIGLGQQLMDRVATGYGTQPAEQMLAGRPGQPATLTVQQPLFRGAGIAKEAKPFKPTKAQQADAERQTVMSAAEQAQLKPDQLEVIQQGVAGKIPPAEIKARLDEFVLTNAKEIQNGLPETQAPAQTQEVITQPEVANAVTPENTAAAQTAEAGQAAQTGQVSQAGQAQVLGDSNAVQEQVADGEVQRSQGPEVGLPEVGKGNAQPEVAAQEGQTQVEEDQVNADQAAETPLPEVQEKAQPEQPLQDVTKAEQRWAELRPKDAPELKDLSKEARGYWEDAVADGYANEADAKRLTRNYRQAQVEGRAAAAAESEAATFRDEADSKAQPQPNWEPVQADLTEAKTLGDALRNARTNRATSSIQKVLINTLLGLNAVETAKFGLSKTDKPESVGTYYPEDHRVELHNGGSVQALLHESLHAAALKGLQTDAVFNKRITQLLEQARAALEPKPTLDGGKYAQYGLTDVDEFVSEAFTNGEFQQKLAKIESKSTTLPKAMRNVWGQFVEAVRNLVGLDGSRRSMLDDIMESAVIGIERTAGGAVKAEPKQSRAFTMPTFQQVQDTIKRLPETQLGDKAYTSALRYFTTLDQLVDLAKDIPAFGVFRKAVQAIEKHTKQWTDELLPTAAWWTSQKEAQRKVFDDLLRDVEASGLRPDKPIDAKENAWGTSPKRWGKEDTPLWENTTQMRAFYNELKQRYNALPDEAKANFTKVFDAGAKSIEQHMNGVIAAVNRNITDPVDRKDIIAKVKKQWKDAISGRPYLPHRWYGNWKLEVEYSNGEHAIMAFESESEAKQARNALLADGHEARYFRTEEFYAKQQAFSRSAMTEIDAAIEKNLKGEAAENLKRAVQEAYYSSLPETAGAQRLRRRKGTAGWERSDLARAWSESMMAMARMTAKMENMDVIRDAMEDAARDAGRHKNVYVVSWWEGTGEERKNFQAKIVRNATDLADERKKHPTENFHVETFSPKEGADALKTKLRYAPDEAVRTKIAETLKADADKIAEEFKAKRKSSEQVAKDQALVDALQYRYEQMLTADSSHPISNALTTLGFVYYLGWTPAFAIMNLTQVPMLSAPRLAAKFGMSPAMGALKRSYGLVYKNRDMLVKLMRAATVAPGESDVIDIAKMKGLTDDQKKMLQEMMDRGALDFTQDSEMHALAKGMPMVLQRVIKSATWLAHPTEVMNRMVTSLAAYDLAKAKTSTDEAAYNMVESIVQETQMNYSPSNRMAVLNSPVARPLLQFKQYGQQVTYMLGKAIRDALSKETDPEVRKEQKAFLLYTLLSSGMLGGVNGLPFMGTILLLISAIFGDDDEPLDARYELGKALGPVAANGVIGSYLTDWSRRTGLGDVLPIPGLSGSATTAPEARTRDKIKNMAFDALGPAGSIAAGFGDAVDAIDRGEALRALESALPKAGKDVLKAARYSGDGLTSSDGIVRVGGDKFSLVDLAFVAGGFKPATEGDVTADANYLYARSKFAALRASLLVKQYTAAQAEGDDTSGIQEKIDAFNEANPANAITPKRIKKFIEAKQNRQKIADAMGGLGFTKKDQELAQQLGLLE